MFSKSASYFCDGDAIQEKASTAGQKVKMADGWDTGPGAHGTIHRNGREKGQHNGAVQSSTRNPRSVWTISSEPYKEAHFATFPGELARRCIVAGTSAKGCCPACGSPWAPVVESERVATRPGTDTKCHDYNGAAHPASPYRDHTEIGNRDPQRHIAVSAVKGYRQTCDCPEHQPGPCIVLDPFAGSGTVGQVCGYLGREFIGIELNPAYAVLAEKRIATPWIPPKSKRPAKKRAKVNGDERRLFA